MNQIPLYIHLPFCKKRCNYCDFCSFVPIDTRQEMKDYFSSLKKELLLKKDELDPATVTIPSLYFGGGTPSLAEPHHFRNLIGFIAQEFKLDSSAEISMEVNPESVDLNKLRSYRTAGINRLSIGIQSLDDRVLKYLGRLANKKQNLKAAENAVSAGFKNISFDLMFGLPLQGKDEVTREISTLMKFKPVHFSLYNLILHRGTSLFKQIRKERPEVQDERRTYENAVALLMKNGFKAYELSNFAKPGFECRHNLSYWNYEEYSAAGISAVGRRGNIRHTNHTDPARYLKAVNEGHLPIKQREVLSQATMKNEYIMMNLRKTGGIQRKEYAQLFGTDLIEEHGPAARLLRDQGFVGWSKGRFTIRKKGRFISNSVIIEFFK